jgi:hypothetical protein
MAVGGRFASSNVSMACCTAGPSGSGVAAMVGRSAEINASW